MTRRYDEQALTTNALTMSWPGQHNSICISAISVDPRRAKKASSVKKRSATVSSAKLAGTGVVSPAAIATSGRTEEPAPRGRLINATGRLYADNPGAVSLMRGEAIKQITMANAFSAEIATRSTRKNYLRNQSQFTNSTGKNFVIGVWQGLYIPCTPLCQK